MDNNQEKNEHGFVKSTETAYKKAIPAEKKSGSSIKTVFISLISAIIGAVLVLVVCLYVPAVNSLLAGDSTDEDEKKTTTIFTSEGTVSTVVDMEEYSDTSISVANKVLPSVVGIEVNYSVTSNYPTFSAATQSSTATATGSGVIITEDGYILTNNHVVDTSSSSDSSDYYSSYSVSEATSIMVYLYNEDDPIEAEVIGTDSVTDLAVLKIDRDNLTAIEYGDSDSVQVGEFVMAIGSPLELRNTVTTGIISGVDREITDSTTGTTYTLIQTDAAINSGNSGGALVNAEGKLIGINTLKMSGTGVEGLGFAIPINSTLDITEQLISTGKVIRPYIGITGADVTETYSQYYNLPVGIYVNSIEDDGPAKDSDLKVGDVIIKFNGETVETMSELNKLKNECEIGDTVTLTVSRDGEEIDVDITLVATP